MRNLIINSNETCFPITWDKPHVCLVNAHFSKYEYITSLIKSMACVFPYCWLCLCAREPLEKICHMFISSSRNSCCQLIQDISPALLGQQLRCQSRQGANARSLYQVMLSWFCFCNRVGHLPKKLIISNPEVQNVISRCVKTTGLYRLLIYR